MRKITVMIVALTALFFLAGCGGGESGKYADYRELLGSQITAMKDFTQSLDKADNAAATAEAIANFNEELKSLSGKMSEIEKKYPELAALPENPPELNAELDQLETANTELEKVLMKKMQYLLEAEVKEAYDTMTSLIGELGI